MSLRNTATKGAFWTFLQQFSTQLIGFGVSIVLARLLMPEEFGLIGMISIFMGIGSILISGGLTQSLIRTENPDQEDYSTVFFFNLIGSIFIYFLVFVTAPLIADFYGEPILINIIRVYCLSFIITAFSAVQSTRLTKIMDFKTQMLVAIPSLIVSGLLGVYLAFTSHGVWSLVWMGLSQSFLSTVQLWVRSKWKPSLIFNVNKFKFHFQFGYKLTLSGLLDTIFLNIYQIIIGKYFLTSQVGFYTRADSLKQLPVKNISSALNRVTYPLFASINNDDLRLKRVYKEIMQLVVFVIAPILVIMGVLAEPLFRFLFTEKWLPAVPYFQVLCLAGILYPIHSYNLNILNVKGRSDLFLRLEIMKKILVLAVVAISFNFGVLGLVWGQLITSILAFFINTHYTGKFINYKPLEQALDVLPILALAFFVGASLWFADTYLHINELKDFFRITILALGGSVIYLTFAYIFKMTALTSIKKIILKQ
ncbi:O-antigen/teichoic acid export membrane protein [Gelidibacter sediminis]|uniref:O-antigen/teichoic acid export membrane protein n=1 Tax=Gelidibacter sediminis TaxID=1608710 RepID=A0A4R7Q5Z9_9FLAO|nr:lipopolysaccharide biosynthesis protein [Gelidibacter sediminis]TDU42898.1 O-antigen/teichoic acid export membrane protein [Gelidibacter sediminis]